MHQEYHIPPKDPQMAIVAKFLSSYVLDNEPEDIHRIIFDPAMAVRLSPVAQAIEAVLTGPYDPETTAWLVEYDGGKIFDEPRVENARKYLQELADSIHEALRKNTSSKNY